MTLAITIRLIYSLYVHHVFVSFEIYECLDIFYCLLFVAYLSINIFHMVHLCEHKWKSSTYVIFNCQLLLPNVIPFFGIHWIIKMIKLKTRVVNPLNAKRWIKNKYTHINRKFRKFEYNIKKVNFKCICQLLL